MFPRKSFRKFPEVVQEINEPNQAVALATALNKGFLRQEALLEIPALSLYAELVKMLGKGESACLSLAVTNAFFRYVKLARMVDF